MLVESEGRAAGAGTRNARPRRHSPLILMVSWKVVETQKKNDSASTESNNKILVIAILSIY